MDYLFISMYHEKIKEKKERKWMECMDEMKMNG